MLYGIMQRLLCLSINRQNLLPISQKVKDSKLKGEWLIWKRLLWRSTVQEKVSLITPTLHISTTCALFEIPWHSWAVVTSSKHSVGHKGMFLATKILASTAVDLFIDSNILVQMKKEFDTSRNGYVYKSGIPKDRKPPKRFK